MKARVTGKVAAIGLVLVGSAVFACTGDLLASVHFNSTGTDLALPPSPLLIGSWEEYAVRDATAPSYDYDPDASEANEARRKRVAETLAKAQATAADRPTPENLRAAALAARASVELGQEVDSARDRAEAFEIASRTPSPTLGSYLDARGYQDKGNSAEARKLFNDLLRTEKLNTSTDPLASHWLYLEGIASYDLKDDAEAANVFEGSASLKTSRRAPALIMVARTTLRKEKPTARDLTRAKSALDQLDAEFGGGRFAWSSVGWRGRIAFVSGQRGRALAAYLRQSDSATTTEERINALASIRQTLARFNAADSTAFRAEVRKDPALLRPYLDYRIHHSSLTTAGRTSLYAFAKEFGIGRAKVGGDLRASLAEMAILAGDTAGAAREANAALAAGTTKADLAHYVLGGVAMRAGNLKIAEAEFRAASKGAGPVARGAKEPLALILERTKRLGEAADVYQGLGYDYDYAYLLDVKMSLSELKAYAERQPESRSALVRYSYGMRLLRKERYDEAERLFAELGNARLKLAQPGSKAYAWNSEEGGMPTDLLFDPLATARDLRAMKTTIEGARDEAKPEAMYALASYYYTRRNLLLYNAPLWEGGRSVLSGFSAQTNDATDRKARLEHAYEHECLARARATCLAIAKLFPTSPWAAKALYRAATAERRLANFNPQWRDISKYRGNLWRQAAAHLEELATRFPNDPLAANARKYAQTFQEEAGDEWKAPAAPAKPALIQ